MPRPEALVISCEHASNAIPARWQQHFTDAAALDSHRGWDPGALTLAQKLKRRTGAPLVAAGTSRLLVDLNRSLHNPGVFSEWSKPLPADERRLIVTQIYQPFRDALNAEIEQAIAAHGRVLHLSIHSFTPALNGITRNCDFAVLYDPSRGAERKLALDWQARWRAMGDEFPMRRNYPYRGVADGSATALRKRFSESEYLGFELELNQGLLQEAARWQLLQKRVCELAA